MSMFHKAALYFNHVVFVLPTRKQASDLNETQRLVTSMAQHPTSRNQVMEIFDACALAGRLSAEISFVFLLRSRCDCWDGISSLAEDKSSWARLPAEKTAISLLEASPAHL